MKKQKEGVVNNIIYVNTSYQDSKCRIYPTITNLFGILREIIQTEETTESILITPFYINEKLDFQEELDIGVFYLKCADTVTVEDKQNFLRKQMYWLHPDSDYKILENYISMEDVEHTNFLVEKKDITGFQDRINRYMDYLMIRGIPQMMVWLYDMTTLDVESLPYGYFCFEIVSS